MAGRFKYLRTEEVTSPTSIWQWARHLVDDLNKLRKLYDLVDADLTGKGGHTVRVKADESGFEITP